MYLQKHMHKIVSGAQFIGEKHFDHLNHWIAMIYETDICAF